MVEKEGIEKVVKAQSLIQSIYLCVVLILLIGSLFLLSDLKGKLLHHYDDLNDHIYQHLKLKDHYLTITDEPLKEHYTFPSMGLNSSVQEKGWGICTMLLLKTSKTDFNDDLSSFWKIKSHPSTTYILRTVDKGFAVKYKGDVTLKGSLMLPEKSYTYNKLQAVVGSPSQLSFQGDFVKATSSLPQLKDDFVIPKVNEEFRFRESEININLLTNSFKQPTIEISLENKRLNDVQVYGNVIIKSSDIVEIGGDSKIEEAIIAAPRVIIKKGFKGSVQVLATEFIDIEQDVQLYSGTTLYLKTNGDRGQIQIAENSIIKGNVVLIADDSQSSIDSFSRLVMSKGTQIDGDIYCQGVSFLKGIINGHVYTSAVGTLTGKEENLNIISDVVIKAPLTENKKGLAIEDTENPAPRAIISKMF